MPLSINTNVSSLYAQSYLNGNSAGLSKTLQRLSSGFRVNSAGDDAAGYAIAANMKVNIDGLSQSSRNGQDGINMLRTAQGSLQVIMDNLQRMSTLAVQASNGSNGSADLSKLNTEYQSLLSEITRVGNVTKFNGVDIVNGGSMTIQIGNGSTANDYVSVTLADVGTGTADLNIAGTDVTTRTNAQTAITRMNTAIGTLTTSLATLGAQETNLTSAIKSNETYITNLTAARGAIIDTDYAAESSNMAKFNILNQSGVAMLAQANSVPQLVLQLLQG